MKLQKLTLLIIPALLPVLAGSQEPEPGVQTSSAAQEAAQVPARVNPDSRAKSPAVRSKPAVPAPATAPAPALASGGKAGSKSSDKIQLETTQISGNQELPKVMYVVPWRKADPGEFAGRPPNSLLDEALTPVDRDVFKRQNRYYGALQTDSASKDEK